MIITEFYRTREDGVNLYKTYSDRNMKIKQNETNRIFSSAVDVEGKGYTYTETDEPIPERPTRNLDMIQAARILMGEAR